MTKRCPAGLVPALSVPLLFLRLCLPASAAQLARLESEPQEPLPPRKISVSSATVSPERPLLVRMMLHPIRKGMFIGLPVMDTDPNRGITVGVMPIWVIKQDGSDRISSIHAPSLTHNSNFGVKPTYRYYRYPTSDSVLVLRGSFSKFEREGMGDYQDRFLAGTLWDLNARVQYEIDASKRFFGVGPNTQKGAETNYKADYFLARAALGHPIDHGLPVHLRFADHFLAEKVTNGPLENLHTFDSAFPGVAPREHQQTNEMRVSADYDTRDHANTTTKGAFVELYSAHSIRGWASSYDFNRYGADARWFVPWAGKRRSVTAAQVKFEQMRGTAPFWLLPSLGGKYSLRAYGEGRYADRGMASASLEQRVTLYEARMAGVTTEFEAAPFVGLGTVFNSPSGMSRRYARPVVGGALRAVARPQVVGSLDFGVGQEGVAVFMDINYSF